MHLISALASGVTGAENGSASIYRRGTATPTTWYEDFEGAGPKTGDVTLDLHGGAEVYVNELVTVTVRDLDGGAVRTFTAGVDAPAVEVKSQSFTGTNYETAITGAGEPTTLQKVLDGWFDSAGAVDFQVLVNGNPTNISTFSDLVTENVFNVQDEAYGATGDGTTDDSSAIQAALNAANSAEGGTVYFPPGTYFITSGLTVAGTILLRGAGATLSVIVHDTQTSGVTNGVTLNASSVVRIEDLGIESNDNSAAGGSHLVCNGTTVEINRAAIGAGSGAKAVADAVRVAAGELYADACTFNVHAEPTFSTIGVKSEDGSNVTFSRCKFYSVGSTVFTNAFFVFTDAATSGAVVACSDCLFDWSSVTSGTSVTCVDLNETTNDSGSVIGGSMISAGGSVNTFLGSTPLMAAFATHLSGANALYGNIHYSGKGSRTRALNDASLSVDPSLYDTEFIIRTDATALSLTTDESHGAPFGMRFMLVVRNDSGGTAVTFSTGFSPVSNPTVGAGDHRVFQFIKIGSVWVEVGTSADTA